MKYDTDYFIHINNTKNEGNCQDMNIKIKKIVYISLLVAIFVVIGKFLTIDLGTIKLTVKRTTDLDVNNVNIKIKNIEQDKKSQVVQ